MKNIFKKVKMSALSIFISIILILYLLLKMESIVDQYVRADYFYPEGTYMIQKERTYQYLCFQQRKEFFYFEPENILLHGVIEDIGHGVYELFSFDKDFLGTVIFRNKNAIIFVRGDSKVLLMDKASDVAFLIKTPDD